MAKNDFVLVVMTLLLATAAPALGSGTPPSPADEQPRKAAIQGTSPEARETAYERRQKARKRLEEALAAGLGPKKLPAPREVKQ